MQCGGAVGSAVEVEVVVVVEVVVEFVDGPKITLSKLQLILDLRIYL